MRGGGNEKGRINIFIHEFYKSFEYYINFMISILTFTYRDSIYSKVCFSHKIYFNIENRQINLKDNKFPSPFLIDY